MKPNTPIKKRDKLRRLLSALKLMEDNNECFTCCAISRDKTDPMRVWYTDVLHMHSGAPRGTVQSFWERDYLNEVHTDRSRFAHRLMWLAFLHTLVSNNLE
jgi:hypothetical protein